MTFLLVFVNFSEFVCSNKKISLTRLSWYIMLPNYCLVQNEGISEVCINWEFTLVKDLEKPIQPQFILNVEKDELFINAGLQDRVIQVGFKNCKINFVKKLSSYSYLVTTHDYINACIIFGVFNSINDLIINLWKFLILFCQR